MNAPELKPCPFCGGKKLDAGYNEFGGLVTLCANCEAHGPSSEADKEQILAAWNTRADLCDPTQDKRVKALEDENARLRDACHHVSLIEQDTSTPAHVKIREAARYVRAALRDTEQDT